MPRTRRWTVIVVTSARVRRWRNGVGGWSGDGWGGGFGFGFGAIAKQCNPDCWRHLAVRSSPRLLGASRAQQGATL
eukprot:712062-Pyramimonas_sp.AAC.1